MKKFFVVCLMMAATISSRAATPNDTVGIDQTGIRWVESTSVVKGKETTKYYAVYKGNLCSTTKNVKEKAELCTKYNVRCALGAIGKTVKGVFVPKRIVLL